MKNLFKNINVFGVIAMLFVASATFAFKAPRVPQTNRTWVQTSAGVWVDATGMDYNCDASDAICSKSYPEGQTPYTNPTGGIDLGQRGFAEVSE